jgi:hypothetical protein
MSLEALISAPLFSKQSARVFVPVAPMTTDITKHSMFHIRWISMHKCLYVIYFPLLYVLRSYLIALIHLSVCKFFLFLLLIIISGPFAKTSLSVCTPCFHNTVIFVYSYSHTGLGTREYQLSGTAVPRIMQTHADLIMSYYIFVLRQKGTS